MAANITLGRSGARTVELLLPFEFQGLKIEAITIGPCTLDHKMLWAEAFYKNWFHMMASMCMIPGVNTPVTDMQLRQLRYPDADRVIGQFHELLPFEIRQAILNDEWPSKELRDAPAPPPVPGAELPPHMAEQWAARPDEGLDIES